MSARGARGMPWIITRESNLGWECLRCGDTAALKLPVSLDLWLATAKAFLEQHKDCKE